MPDSNGTTRPRLLIEDWLPAAALGVECMRERGSASALAPTTFLHVWWARRPLAASRAAVLASVLPAGFPRELFERLLGFGRGGDELVAIRQLMDTGVKVEGGFGAPRAFKGEIRSNDLALAHSAATKMLGHTPSIMDPMSGGGSIPLESARLGFNTFANEYNPVACSVLEATLDYPFRFGPKLSERARFWGREWEKCVATKLGRFFPKEIGANVHAYLFARTVPCPTTGHMTPLVPDWHLLKPKGGIPLVAVPIVNKKAGTWTTEIRPVGIGPGNIASVPHRTYAKGKGISLFTGEGIPSDWIKAQALACNMGSALYAVALKTPQGLKFRPPVQTDLDALDAAQAQLAQWRGNWEANNLIPTEEYPEITTDRRPRTYGMPRWADMFSPRQLLTFGVLMEELHALRTTILAQEGVDLGEAIVHLMAFGIDKFTNYDCMMASWHVTHQVIRGVFDRHDFSFKFTFAEMAPVVSGGGLTWALDNACSAFEDIARLPKAEVVSAVEMTQGSATSLIHMTDQSLDAIVVDPPYSDNVQYSELADFFYVWLKRSQGHRRPEWFSSLLCENTLEAVKNDARFRDRFGSAKLATKAAQDHYQKLMTEVFTEAHRVLRVHGVLTVMFTHKKQEAWEALFASLIDAGFTITATWPVKTESEHSLHQAKKNAAQSTVILVARVRTEKAGTGYFDAAMQARIRAVAEAAANRLLSEGLNPVDQLIGSFGPAMEVFSAYDAVRTDTGDAVSVGAAIDIAADAVAGWRIRKLAAGGLQGVEPEAQFALLCWDTLGAAEFRFNEAKLLGHAVGMDVSSLELAGLIAVKADKVNILSAADRRRDAPLREEEAQQLLFGTIQGTGKKAKKSDALKIHPRDPVFRTHLDRAQALALAYADAGGGAGGIGAARALANRHGVKAGDPTVRLIEALLKASPLALRRDKGAAALKFPEFRAWHTMLQPLFGIISPDWTEKGPDQGILALFAAKGTVVAEEEEAEIVEDEDEEEDDADE
jgi:Adenine-specific DNA methylase containing a Zn-ribbon